MSSQKCHQMGKKSANSKKMILQPAYWLKMDVRAAVSSVEPSPFAPRDLTLTNCDTSYVSYCGRGRDTIFPPSVRLLGFENAEVDPRMYVYDELVPL